MKIKYVGVKEDGETAFSRETGLTWMPGDVHEVADKAIAAKMITHPDVFAPADEPVGLANAKPAAAPTDETQPAQWANTPDGEAVLLSDMSKEDLHALAKKYEVKVHHSAGAAKVIEALQEAFAVKAE